MKISIQSVETFIVRLPPRKDFRWLSLSRPLGEFVLARITAGGVQGWGEIVALRDWGDIDGRRHGETPATVCAVVHDQLAPWLLDNAVSLGDLARSLDTLVVGNPYAKALIDIAAHDLVGRAYGVPVHALLGGRARDEVSVAHMLGIMPNAEALAEARTAVSDGVRAFQVKGGADLERDVDLIRSLREEHGKDVWLRLDANGGYRSRVLARRALRSLADAGADFVEQPMLGAAALAQVIPDSPVAVIADEGCWTPTDALDLTARRTVDAISVYVGKAGGLARARAMCGIAAAAHLPHDLNGALELGIGNAANLHLALSSPAELLPCVIPVNAPAGSSAVQTAGRYFEDDIVSAPFPYRDGALLSLDGAGLGVEIDMEKVERYCVGQAVTPAQGQHRA